MNKNPGEIVRKTVVQKNVFIKAVFANSTVTFCKFRKIVIRPVVIKHEYMLQISYFTKTQDITKNYPISAVPVKVNELMRFAFENITLSTTDETIIIHTPKRGKAAISVVQNEKEKTPILSHDRQKNYILQQDVKDAYLEVFGIQNSEGHVYAAMQRKFTQINQFLLFISKQQALDILLPKKSINLLDLGCGNGYLTAITHHYFTDILQKQTRTIGVDRREDLIKELKEKASVLHAKDLEFIHSDIATYEPHEKIDIVLSLHACDTATDDALLKAIRLKSELIFSSPCCHNYLQSKIQSHLVPFQLKSIFHHPILKQRMGDIVTDTFRSLILQIMGYDVNLVEFVTLTDSPKNLLIEAIRKPSPIRQKQAVSEYETLKRFWRVTPYLEILLGELLCRTIKENR